MNVRELLTKWGFEIDHKKLTTMEKQLEGIKHRLDFLAGVEIAKALFELGEKFSKIGDNIHIAAEQAGITVEAYQKLAYSASLASVSQEELTGSMAKLARNLYNARKGGAEASKAFADIGISDSQVRGFRTAQDALFVMSDRFKRIKDPIQKAALAQQLLGRSSSHMVSYLSQGSKALKAQGMEAEELGMILGEDQVKALKDLETALTRFWSLLKAIGATIAATIAPVIKFLIDDFIKFFHANKQLIEVNVVTWLGDVAYAMGFVWEAIKYGAVLVTDLASKFGFEDRILSIVAAFGSFIGALFLTQKLLKSVISTFTFLKNLFTIVGSIVGSTAFLVAASIGAIVVAAHDLYQMLFNGKDFKETWIGKFLDSFGLVDKMYEMTDKLYNGWEKFNETGSISQGISAIGGPANPYAPGMGPAPSAASGAGAGNQKYDMNAPITINVPGGMDPKMAGENVQKGVREHLDRVFRETQRSSKPQVAY